MLNDTLRILRVFHDLKANELARRLKISPSYLSEIEKGKKDPTLELLNKYGKEFKIPTSVILFLSESKPGSKKAGWLKRNLAPKIIRFLKEIEDAGVQDLSV